MQDIRWEKSQETSDVKLKRELATQARAWAEALELGILGRENFSASDLRRMGETD